MRKRIIPPVRDPAPVPDDDWLDAERWAEVEITSEEPDHPVETALVSGAGGGWRAANAGEQTIRLRFETPQRIRRVRLEFVETAVERTQQFVLRWRAEGEEPVREIVRQQWNFSPAGATSETEDYRVDLPNAAEIELTITPDIRGGEARASLQRLRLA